MASKNSPQQEMVQVDGPDKNASPFWRNRPLNARNGSGRATDPNAVFGASYSHADILKFDSLSLTPSNSRPHTPTSSSKSNSHPAQSPPHRTAISSPPKRPTYPQPLSQRQSGWGAGNEDEDDEDDDDEQYYYSENLDEDEFGLPSITSVRREAKNKPFPNKLNDPGGGLSKGGSSISTILPPEKFPGGGIADSSDIAEVRESLSYPLAKKSEGKILRPQYKDILRDPANSLHLINYPPIPPNASAKELEAHSSRISRINKFKRILQASSIPLVELRNSSWSGIPEEVRAMSWQLLLGYLPASSERRVATLERKRKAYLDGVRQAFERGPSTSGEAGPKTTTSAQARVRGLDEALWHQISIDVPRTSPHLELYSYEATQRSLERILYVWAIRHPASGYVQGINDLVTPFWQVFLGSYITDNDVESGMDPGQLPRPVLDAVEADSFWCLTKLLEGIQDNYIFAQPGIVRQVSSLRDLTIRIDSGLAKHLESEGVEFMQFSFRWMNCLLMREVSVRNTIRMWDTYMAEEQGFSDFHLYVCAAFLVKWSEHLVKMDFQEIMMFLQALPTRNWTEKDIELLLTLRADGRQYDGISFLNLPAEIRIVVYPLCLLGQHGDLKSNRKPPSILIADFPLADGRAKAIVATLQKIHPFTRPESVRSYSGANAVATSLLRLSKQIHSDGPVVLYSENEFQCVLAAHHFYDRHYYGEDDSHSDEYDVMYKGDLLRFGEIEDNATRLAPVYFDQAI